MFPQWLNELFPVDESGPCAELARHIANKDCVTTCFWSAREIASATTNLVCHPCNTGWMSRLERRAKPVLRPLISGKGRRLNLGEQLLMSTWAAKTAIVIEATLSLPEDNFTTSECEVVMCDDRPPASIEIDVSGVQGPIAPMSYACAKVMMTVGEESIMKLHFHTVQVGALVFSILRRDPPPSNYGSLERIAVPREVELPFDVATKIFPPRGACQWPPARVLEWAPLVEMTKRGLDMPIEWAPPDPLAGPFQSR